MREHPAGAVLARQESAWNAGDLEGYLAECDEEIVYLSARGLVRGRAALRGAMAAAYPDRAAMGFLSLELVEWELSPGMVTALLRWQVARAEGTSVGGHALVVLVERDGRWWLRQDATVAA